MKEIYLENRTINPKTGNRHSKFYRMTQTDALTFVATWGRIGAPGKTKSYDMIEWWDISEKKRAKGYSKCTEHVDDFQSKLNPEIIEKLEKLIYRVELHGVKSDLPKAQTLLNTYKRMRTLDKKVANNLFTKYSSKSLEVRKEKRDKFLSEKMEQK